MSYSVNDDYCGTAKGWQAVPSDEDARNYLSARGKDTSAASVKDYREGTKYPCDDSYQMGTINKLYSNISRTSPMRKDNINYNKILRFFEIPKRGPTSSEIESINRWVRDYGFEEDMIARAAEITLERTGSPNFRYADAILRDWKNKGYHNYSRKLAKQTKGYEFSWKNIKKNLRHEMGWKTSHVVKNKETGKSASVRGPYLNKKEAFNPFSDLTKMKEGRKRSKVVMKNIKTINGNYKNAKNLITGPSKIAEGIKGLSDGKSKDNTVWGNVKKIGEGANDVGGTLPVYDPIGYVTSGIEQLTGIADLLNEYKTTPNYVKETFTAYGY